MKALDTFPNSLLYMVKDFSLLKPCHKNTKITTSAGKTHFVGNLQKQFQKP